jgi:hypothetical protein
MLLALPCHALQDTFHSLPAINHIHVHICLLPGVAVAHARTRPCMPPCLAPCATPLLPPPRCSSRRCFPGDKGVTGEQRSSLLVACTVCSACVIAATRDACTITRVSYVYRKLPVAVPALQQHILAAFSKPLLPATFLPLSPTGS